MMVKDFYTPIARSAMLRPRQHVGAAELAVEIEVVRENDIATRTKGDGGTV
jgi:hypothetical protein